MKAGQNLYAANLTLTVLADEVLVSHLSMIKLLIK